NNCWKNDTTDWVLVCDVDEWLDIDKADLDREDAGGATLIKSIGYNMVNLNDDYDVQAITHGVEDSRYSKDLLFKRTMIQEMNYRPGAHESEPVGLVRPSHALYPA